MNKQISIIIVGIIAFSAFITACSKNGEDTPIANTRAVKIELNGNYTGNISLSYTNQKGIIIKDTITTLPWVKEIPYFNKVDSVKVSGLSDDMTNLGAAGQTASVKIFSAGEEKVSQSATADGAGVIKIPAVSYGL